MSIENFLQNFFKNSFYEINYYLSWNLNLNITTSGNQTRKNMKGTAQTFYKHYPKFMVETLWAIQQGMGSGKGKWD